MEMKGILAESVYLESALLHTIMECFNRSADLGLRNQEAYDSLSFLKISFSSGVITIATITDSFTLKFASF